MPVGELRLDRICSAIAVCGLALATAALAGPKEDIYSEMESLAVEIMTSKGQLEDPARAAEYDLAMARYQELSASLGGDDPGRVLGESSTPSPESANRGIFNLPPMCTTTRTAIEDTTIYAINDNSSFAAQMMAAGLGTDLWTVSLDTSITHTFPGDLDITLTSPAGSETTVTTDNGGGSDDVFNGSVWYDETGLPATDYSYTTGVTATPLIVEEALTLFRGEDPNGTWTLDVADDAGGDTGNLSSWILTLATLDAPVTVGATVSATDATPTAIVDNTTFQRTVDLSGADPYTCSVQLETFITHTFPGDLDITLTSPLGTTVVVTTDNGGSNDDAFNGTTFRDNAGSTNPPGPVSDATYTTGVTNTPLAIEGAFEEFLGEDPNGTWTLTVGDDAGGDTGSLDEWTVTVTGCSCAATPPPPTPAEIPTQSPLGLLLLGLLLTAGALHLFRR